MLRELRFWFAEILKAVTVIVILLSSIPLLPKTTDAVSLSSYETCVATYDKKFPSTNPPNGIKCIVNKSTGEFIYFNATLFNDQQVIAYGITAAANANSPSNFKSSWKDPKTGTVYKDKAGLHPYFTNTGGAKGEYRYYGWDVNGNLYTNIYFPDDNATGTDPDLKKYIYRPWSSNLLNGKAWKPDGFGPLFKGTEFTSPYEIYTQGQETLINNMLKSSGVNIQYQAKDSVTDPRSPKNLFDYMYVQQAPTTQAPGSGRLFHQNSDGSLWYQTYPIDQQISKERLDIQTIFAEDKAHSNGGFNLNLKTLGKQSIWTWKLGGQIMDDDKIQTLFDRTRYYTRFDIDHWELDILVTYPGGKTEETLKSTNSGDMTIQNTKKIALRNPNLSITLDKSNIKSGDQLVVSVTAKAYYFGSKQPDTATTKKTYTFDGKAVVEDAIVHVPTNDPETGNPFLPPPVVCKPNIPGDAFDIVPFAASDDTDLSRIANRTVMVDGQPVDPEAFFSGNYVFGDDVQGLHIVSMKWTPNPGEDKWGADMCDTYRIINVHDTKPRAQFKLNSDSFKENRVFSVDNTSSAPEANDSLVISTYPIVSAQWSWSAIDGSDSDRRMKLDGQDHKEFLYKKPGEYQLTLTVTNALGRTSDPYVLPFSVIPDYDPALIMYPYSSQIARNEPLSMFFDAVSTDGDIIKNTHFDVYYDESGDESYTQLIDSFDAPVSQYVPKGGKLGKYRIVASVDEDYGQPTFTEFTTSADKRSSTTQFEFQIDNYLPYSDIYTDIPTIRQQVDTGILLDKNLAQDKIDYVKSNGVAINNQMRYEGMDPIVNIWDMHTYTYSQPASTVKNTGGYPPSTTAYTSNGYSGTLNLISASDNGSYHDYGHNETVVDVPAHTETEYVPWCYGTVDGQTYSHSPPCTVGTNATTKPVSHTVPATYKTVWVSDIRWVANWYGTYSGTIYKDVRQPYSNPFSRATANRYLVYISEGGINDLADFNNVKGLSDAKIILVGTEAVKSQTNYDYFIKNTGQSIETIIQAVVDYMASQNPPTATQTVLVNEPFNVYTTEADPENDPMPVKQTEYTHDENFYDNSLGHASFAQNEFDEAKWTNETLRTSFSLPGEYRIYRRVQDQPSTDPALQKYNYWSNDAYTVIRVHRKPIAKATLDWTYDSNCNCYNTSWVDQSYDLDHNISDPVNRGIVERKVKYSVGGEWYYQVPDHLSPGTYHLEYVVKDEEGAWSDPFTMDFVLQDVPPPQLKANLKSTDGSFTLAGGVPASESLTAYQLWTRFPYSLNLQLTMGSYIHKSVSYFTGTKVGSDINWDDVVTPIPATTPDGTYNYRVQANGSNGTNAYKDFSVKIATPINLSGTIDSAMETNVSQIVVGYPFTFKAQTTEYPNTTTVTLFKGTSKQTTLNLTGTVTGTAGVGAKSWTSASYTVPAMADGNYTFEWTSRTPNGNVQTVTKTMGVINNRPPTADFNWSPTLIYEGDTVAFTTLIGDPDRDTLQVKYEFESPSGKTQTFSDTRSSPYSTAGPQVVTRDPGVWTVTLTVSDGKAAPVAVTKTFRVLPLTISGQVRHTDDWEANRLHYNDKYPEAKRPANWFWAGEAFVLEAQVTDTGSSATKASIVVADAGDGLRKTLSAVNSPTRTIWKGTLGSADAGFQLVTLPEGDYTFTFTATYRNGVVKTTQASIHVEGTVDEYMQVHRLQ